MAVFSALLIGVDFLDELASGIPFVGSPEIQRDFGLSYGMAAGWLLSAVALLSIFLEAPLFVLADRHPRRWFVCGGLLTLGAVCLLAAAAPSYWVLVLAMMLFGPASGCGVGLSQATLVDANPTRRETVMMRWTLAGELGDLVTPGFLALMIALGLGWRGAFAFAGVACVIYALALWRRDYPVPARDAEEDDDESAPGLAESLRIAARRPGLRRWTVGVLLCDFLDEVAIAFGALYLRDVIGLDLGERTIVLTAFMVGGALGLLASERLLRRIDSVRLLAILAALCAVAWSGWILADSLWVSAALAVAVGLTSSMHYPIAHARAYAAYPERTGTVNGVLVLASAVMLPVPILLGVVADQVGLTATVTLLLIQPLGLLVLALRELR